MDQEYKKPAEKDHISWQSEEFIYHPKSFIWYLQLILGSIIISSIPWLISGRDDFISPLIILISLLALTVYAARKPRVKKYDLTNSTLRVDGRSFGIFEFSYYWVEEFDTHTQITLVGNKRTSMPVGFYIKEKAVVNKVLNVLQKSLPQTNPSQNPFDWLSRKLKL
ncbi:MAG: hypothetical protein QG623_325 [Patescibacteria group bacterium]|nr:hypothetical protein [Patescibacteria group bacterium]